MSSQASDPAYAALLSSLTRAYHRLTSVSDRLHGARGVSTGARSVLLRLAGGLAPTISEIAQDRAVSRQFIQRIVADLTGRGWVTTDPNPRHAGSPLLRLTEEGGAVAEAIRVREAELAEKIAARLPREAVAIAAGVIDQLNDILREEGAGR